MSCLERRRRSMSARLAVIFLLLLTVTASCTSRVSSSPSSAPAATKKIYVSPVDSHRAPAEGYRINTILSHGNCENGSDALGQAYRCFAKHGIYDPCWAVQAPAPTVLCLSKPWSHEATEILLDQGLDAVYKISGAVPPWAIQLQSSRRCLILEGTHGVFAGRAIDYYCDRNVYVLRGLVKQGLQWRAQLVEWRENHYIKGPEVAIAIEWFGIPDSS